MFQPIQNSIWKMAFNLAIAPLVTVVLLLPYLLFSDAISEISPFIRLFSALFIGFFICLAYWIPVYPFLLIAHLLLRHYQLFNLGSSLLTGLLGTFILAGFSYHQPECFHSQFLFLLCFSLPMVLFYSFLSWQSDQNR